MAPGTSGGTTRCGIEVSLPAHARLLILATVGAGIAVAAATAPDLVRWSAGDAAGMAGIAVTVAVAERFQIFLAYRHEEVGYTVSDAVWIGALFFGEPSVVLLGTTVGVVLGQALQPWAGVKLAFNAGLSLVGVGAALTVFGALGAPSADVPAGWGAATAAALTCHMLNALLVGGIIASTEQRPLRRVAVIPPDVLHWVGGIALGLLGAVVWSAAPNAVPLLVVPLVLTYFGYRGWMESARERDLMEEMASTASDIATSGDLSKRITGSGRGGAVAALASTQNLMLDRVEAALERERRFIREASHELRTPITICRGHLETLPPDPPIAELAETHEVVIDELDRMARLVEELSALTRTEDPASLRPDVVPLDRFLQDVAAKSNQLVNGRLQVERYEGDDALHGDPQRLTQALVNLLRNACDHAPGTTPISLRVRPRDGCWRFEVADKGPGLPAGQENEVFRPFVAGRGSTGSGLGLAIVAGIARAHGGSAGVDNHPGAGATFWVQVPR